MAMPARLGQKAKVVTQIKTGEKHHHGLIVQRRRANGNLKPMRFVSLHHHSTFSYLDGYQLPEAHVRRATELQMGAMAMTEHGNIDSHVKFEGACDGTGVKPLFGCEVYMPTTAVTKEGEEVAWDDPRAKTQRKHHLTIIAKDQEGYRNLLQLVSGSWHDFYYDPVVTWDRLVKHKRGLIVLSGCQGSLLFCSTVGGKGIEESDASYRRGLQVAKRFAREFGDNYFIEVQAFPELDKTRKFNKLAGRLARAVRRRLVATMDCHYTMLEEKEVQKILHNLRPGNKQTIEEQAREWGYNAPLCPPPNDNTIFRRLTASGLSKAEAIEAIVSTEEIAQSCNVELPKLDIVRFPVPEGFEDATACWRQLLKDGWRFRGLHRLPPRDRERYKKQLKEEMDLIESKDFVDYFLLVAAGVQFVKGKGIPVGPARGSAAASVAAWLLQITEIDPLNPAFAGLLQFERFISVDREDLPDIDLDFPSEARPMLRDFYTAMLGPGCVTNIGTFIYFKNKMAVDDVARVFHVPRPEVETLKGFLIERSSGDMRASSTIEDTADMFEEAAGVFERYPDLKKSQWIEGMVKGFGVHAAGLALSNEPITSVTSVAERVVGGHPVQVVALDKYDAERQGVLKMDFLGLNTMSMIWDCIQRIDMSLKELYGLRLDDPEVYKLFQAVDMAGVFQFEGRAMRYVCATLKPEKFSEIMDCNALARPGPLHNGAAREYALVKHGGKLVEAKHPAIAEITAPTQHQIIYQEQVLRIARDVGGFGRTMVADIRRLISRKKGEQEFNRRREDFLKGTRSLHKRTDYPPMPDEVALAIWGDMVTSGAYAFNAAHCAAYGWLAYATAWLKRYHPDVFFAAQLKEANRNPERKRYLLRDAAHHGVRIVLPSLKRSEASWAPVRKSGRPLSPPTVRAGFDAVDGIGEKTAARVVEWRDEVGPESWAELQDLKGFGVKTIEKIKMWLEDEDPFGAFKLDRDIANVKEWIAAGARGPDGKPLPIPSHNTAQLAEDRYQGKALQVTWLGTFVQRNVRDIFEQNRARGHELNPEDVKDPHLNEWAMLTGEDEADQMLIKIDRWVYPHVKKALFNFRMGHDLILVSGVKPKSSAVRSIKVKRLWVINPDD